MSKRSAEKPSNPVGWEGVGFGLDIPILYPVLSENPAELLRAIAALRPPGDDAPLARRGPGRPPWTEAEFLEHWREAQSKAAPSDRLADIAAEFRWLNGTTGMDPVYLRRLRRKVMGRSEIPE